MKKVSISTLIILVSHTFFFLIFSQSEGFCEEKLIALMSPKYAISIAGKDITAKFQPMNVGPYSGLALVLCSGKVNTLTVNQTIPDPFSIQFSSCPRMGCLGK